MNDLAATPVAYARPVLEPLGADTPLTRRREALGLAVLVWNAAILDRDGGDHVAMLLEQLARLPDPGRTILTQPVGGRSPPTTAVSSEHGFAKPA